MNASVQFYWLVIGILGVWRVTHLIAVEDGPWRLFARLRHIAAGGQWGTLLGCFYCLSLWVAALFALAMAGGKGEIAGLWLALSGGAVVLERLTSSLGSASSEPPALFHEEEGETDGLLRKDDP